MEVRLVPQIAANRTHKYCRRNLQIYIYNGLQYEGQQTAPQDTTRYRRLHPAKENLVSHGVSAVSVAQYCAKTNSNHYVPSRNLLLKTCSNNYRSRSHPKNSATISRHSRVTVASQ